MIGDIKIFQIIRYMINTHYGLDKSSQQYPDLNIILYNWPAHPDDPQGIRVASVIEFSVGPLPPTIHRGSEWPL